MQLTYPASTSRAYGDEALWHNFKKGSREAFAGLYHRYFGIMITNSLKLYPDKTLIEDCVHDLFIEIWNNKANLGVPRSVKAYLLCSVQRKIIRQVKRKRTSVPYEMADLHDTEVQSIEKKMIMEQHHAEKKKHIHRAIKVLTRRQQEAVLLKFYANLSYPEIAAKMYISTNAIYNLISKAMSQISCELERKIHDN